MYFRVAVVGTNKARVNKVLSLLIPDDETSSSSESLCTTFLPDFEDEPVQRKITVEYVPCTATFDSYQDENNETVRYLAKLEHHGKDGISSLAPFFDEVLDEKENIDGRVRIPGIAAVAIGCGIETAEDLSQISSFIRLLSGLETATRDEYDVNQDFKNDKGKICVGCIRPNQEYSSMKEETAAYRNLTALEKEEVTEKQLIGPGKMAKFTNDLAMFCVPRTTKSMEENTNQIIEVEKNKEKCTIVVEDPLSMLKDYDPNTTRFACKICRTILFSECDLEDPPHSKSQHSFSYRKAKHGANRSTNQCQSVFLAMGMDWMLGVNDAAEGKIVCPKCSAKLGLFKWHGAQCSCGSWVTPAIQIHKSRVDVVPPENQRLQQDHSAMLMSPLARLHIAGQSSI